MCTHNDLLYSALACSYTKSTVAFICVCMYAGTVCMYFCIYICLCVCSTVRYVGMCACSSLSLTVTINQTHTRTSYFGGASERQ